MGLVVLALSVAGLTLCAPGGASTGDAAKKPPKKPGLGLLPSNNHIDPVKPSVGANGVTLPASVDLRANTVPVGYQGSLGSCVTWAIDYALLGWYARRDGRAGWPFNPMYTYSQIHGAEPPGGTTAHRALDIALNQGNDTQAHYSHGVLDYTDLPNASEQANAANYRISQYQALFDNGSAGGTAGEAMIENALAKGQPVAIGMAVRTQFMPAVFSNKATLADATYNDTATQLLGYHEVLAVGYDQIGLWIQNSWNVSWGYKGFARLAWPVVEHDVTTAYTISGFASDTGPLNAKDTTPPTMGGVTQQFSLNTQITSTTEPLTYSWSANDTSGITAYAVYVETDGGKYVYQTAVPATATRFTFSLAIGHSYQIAVAAKDGAGNWSSYSYSAAVKPAVTDDSAFTVNSPWVRYSNLSDAFGGTYIAASDPGAWVQHTFVGTDAALIAIESSNAGRATVFCDGNSNAVGDFYSATTVTREVVATCHFTQRGQHTIRVVNEGTAGRPSLFIDAFALLQ